MLRSTALFLLLFSYVAYGQQHDNIVRYPNGKIKYVLTLVNGDLEQNTCFSYLGDTIYSWDARTCTFIDYRVSGAYLLKAEYESYRQKVKTQDYIEKQREGLKIISGQPPPPSANEYELTHEAFFKKCHDYRLIYREGDFTIITYYKNRIQSGPYLKYYKDKLVVSGAYEHGKEIGFGNISLINIILITML